MVKLRAVMAVLVFACMALALPARAEWRRAESPNFVLYGNASESQLRSRILLLEDFDRLLRMLASGDQSRSPKLHVYFVNGIDDLRVIRPVADGIAGYYIAGQDGIAAFVDSRAEGRGTEILFHEYTHHFMSQHMRAAYPVWYVEGFADYFATVRFASRHIDIGDYSRGRAYSILQGQWLPMERILAGGTDGLDREAMAAYYAQSWLLVHYFYSTPERQQAMARLLRATRMTSNGVQALENALGWSPDRLAQELRRYIRDGQISYRRAPRASADAAPAVAITTMPASTGTMILYEAALRVGIAEENRASYLDRIRTAAERYPDDPLAMRVLAHAELLYGDGSRADGLLDRLLADAPDNAQLLYLKGLRLLVASKSDDPPEGAAASARSWFRRARDADPNHFQAMVRYVESLSGEPEFVSDETRDMLVEASQLAPQIASIALNAANLLIARRDYDQALQLLAPLASNPHDPALGQAARRLMGLAVEHRLNQRKPDAAASEE